MVLRAKLTSALKILKTKKKGAEFNVNDLQKVKFSLYCRSRQDKGLRILLCDKSDTRSSIFRGNKNSNLLKVEYNKPRKSHTCVKTTPEATNTNTTIVKEANSKNHDKNDVRIPSQKCENVKKTTNANSQNSQWFSNPKTKNVNTLKRNYTKSHVNTNAKYQKYHRNVAHNGIYKHSSERRLSERKLKKIRSRSPDLKEINESRSSSVKDFDDLHKRIHNALCKIKTQSRKCEYSFYFILFFFNLIKINQMNQMPIHCVDSSFNHL